MAKKQSAGILLYRFINKSLEFFLVHPGGPFWKNKDAGAWTIPKGEFEDNEEAFVAAKREFAEETGSILSGDFIELEPVQQKGGKKIFAWATEGNINSNAIVSNKFEMEWPPKSGKIQSFPEIDKAGWFSNHESRVKINTAQIILIENLIEKINDPK